MFEVNDPSKKKKDTKKRNWGTYVMEKNCVITTDESGATSHKFVTQNDGSKPKKVDTLERAALLKTLMNSNTQGAKTLKASLGETDSASKKKKSAFGQSAIRKLGMDPFTGAQYLAPPSTIEDAKPQKHVPAKQNQAKVKDKEESKMIELVLEDD
jgi:hypothetical protein